MDSKLTTCDVMVILIIIALIAFMGFAIEPKPDLSTMELSRRICQLNGENLVNVNRFKYKEAKHDQQSARTKISIVCGE